MWMKKCLCVLLSCFTIIGCCSIPASAEEFDNHTAEIIVERSSGKFDFSVPANTRIEADSDFSLDYGEMVTITASYTPASARLEIGLIDSDGNFYLLPASDGSFRAEISIEKRENYKFTIRNNSDYEVSVSGFVTY